LVSLQGHLLGLLLLVFLVEVAAVTPPFAFQMILITMNKNPFLGNPL